MKLNRIACIAVFLLACLSPSTVTAASFNFCALWGNCPVPGPPAFSPVFEGGVTLSNGFGHVDYVNSDYFATAATAQTLCQRLACRFVLAQACDMGGGPAVCSQPERMLVFSDIEQPVNAGILAAYYYRNPENLFPHVADNAVQAELAKLRKK